MCDYTVCVPQKKFMHVLIALTSNNIALLKSAKPIQHWTPQLTRSTKSLFGVCRVNETKVTGAYSRCSRNKVFYHDFFDGADFVSGDTDRYWDKTTP